MADSRDLDAMARTVLDENRYLVLGTGDADGRPWVTPVFYTRTGYDEFHWISSPDARHSRNLTARPEVSVVVFDSQVRVGLARAVYMSGTAVEVTQADPGFAAGVEAYSTGSPPKGGRPITAETVLAPSPYRLYRARITEHWVLDPDSSPDGRARVQP